MNIADKLYITEVDLEIEGDAYFPKIDPELFKEVRREERNKDPEDNAYHSLVIYEKVK